MSNFTRYTDFLKDKQFIRWQLVPDETLDGYWNDFIEKNPDLNDELQHAIDYLKTTGLNNKRLSETERISLLNKIQSSIKRTSKKIKIRRIIRLSVASCAAVVLLLVGLNRFLSHEKARPSSSQQELIVGNLLAGEDIQ